MRKPFIAFLLLSIAVFLLISGCNKSPSTSTGKSQNEEVSLYGVQVDGKWGFIDKNGQMVIQPQYEVGKPDELPPAFREGLAAVRVGGKFGFIDAKGQMVIQPQYGYVSPFSDGIASVLSSGGYGFINKNGKIVIEPQYSKISNFHDGLAAVEDISKLSDYLTFINTKGEVVIQLEADSSVLTNYSLYYFREGLARVTLNGIDYGYIDKSGQMVIQPKYQFAENFSDGLAAVDNGRNWGYIDKNGQMVIPPEFDSADPFSEGLAAIELNNKYGYIDSTGKIVIQPQYDLAFDFRGGLAVVGIDGKYGVIDKSGQLIIQPKYDMAFNKSGDLIMVKVDGKYGYIDKSGRSIWPQDSNMQDTRTQESLDLDQQLFAANNNEAKFKALLASGADPNAKNKCDLSILSVVSFAGNSAGVKALLEAGADVNAKDDGGYTALMWGAMGKGNIDVIKTMLDAGADVNRKDEEGRTALYWAEYNRNNDIAGYLRQHGAVK